jgi:ribosomal protein L9
MIDEPIRSLGVFDVKVKLHPEVTAILKVWVISEE